MAVMARAAVDPDRDLLFRARFETPDRTAELAGGDPGPVGFVAELMADCVKGRQGCGYQRRGPASLTYRAPGNVHAAEGTVSLWIWMPERDDEQYRGLRHVVMLDLENDRGQLKLNLYVHDRKPHVVLAVSAKPTDRVWRLKFERSLLTRDGWTRIDFTWTGERSVVYLDGREVASTPLGPEFARIAEGGVEDGRIRVLPGPRRALGRGDVIRVDELEIRGRALAGAEIGARTAAARGEEPSAGAVITVAAGGLDRGDRNADRMWARYDARGLDTAWRAAFERGEVEARLLLQHGGERIAEAVLDAPGLRGSHVFEMVSSPGAHTVRLAIRRKDGATAHASTTVERPAIDWAGSDAGLEDTVPQPWTPIAIDSDGVVHVWNRAYRFDGPFIRQVESGGMPLLAEPVRLFVDSGQGERPVEFEAPRAVAIRNEAVVFEGVGRSGLFEVRFRNTLWFDGFSRVEIEVGPKDYDVRSLVVRWRTAPEISRHQMTPLRRPFDPGGNAYGWDATTFRDFTLLWLAGREHGFAWIPEHEGGWVYDPDSPPIRLVREPAGAAVALHLIDRPVRLPSGLRYSFGFIATPSRPLPSDFRTFFVNGRGAKHNEAVTIGWGGHGFQHFGSLVPAYDPSREQSYEEYLHSFVRRGWLAFPYASPTSQPAADPVVSWFLDSWAMPGGTAFPIVDARGQDYQHVTVSATPLFRDYWADRVADYLDRSDPGVGGLYYDLVVVHPDTNPIAGAGEHDAFGRRIPYRLATLPLREVLLRSLRIARSHGKRTWYHGHNVYNPAVMGLCDFWYPGEHLADEVDRDPYYYVRGLPQEIYDTEFSSRQKGVGVINLPVVGRRERSRADQPRYTRHMLAGLLLNDVLSAGKQLHAPTIDRLWAIRERYRWDEARFVSFTDNPYFQGPDPAWRASEYILPDGTRFTVVVNATGQPRTGRLGLRNAAAVRDVWRDTPLALEGEKVQLRLEPYDFTILRVRTAGYEETGEDPLKFSDHGPLP